MTATSSWDARSASGSAGSTRPSHAVDLRHSAGRRQPPRTYHRLDINAMERTSSMSKRAIAGGAVGLALVLGLAGCTNPYDPVQRAVGGGLLGAGSGAAIGAAAGGGPGAALGAAIGGAVGVLGGAATTPPLGYYGYPAYGYPAYGYSGYGYGGYSEYPPYSGYPGYGYPVYGYPGYAYRAY